MSELFWHTKNYLVNIQKFWDLRIHPGPNVGKKSKINLYFFLPSAPLIAKCIFICKMPFVFILKSILFYNTYCCFWYLNDCVCPGFILLGKSTFDWRTGQGDHQDYQQKIIIVIFHCHHNHNSYIQINPYCSIFIIIDICLRKQ